MSQIRYSHEARLRQLERRQRFLTTFVILLVGCWLVAATVPDDNHVVRAQRFELVDGSGLVRATLDVRENGETGLFILDDSSRVRLTATHGRDETALFIRDASGDTRLGAAQFAHGGGGFALHGEEMKGAAVVYMKNGKGSFRVFDDDGNVSYEVPGQDSE